MKPILFEIGEFTFPAYTFLIMTGVLVSAWLGVRTVRRLGLPPVYAIDMVIIAVIAGFIGARIGHLLVEGSPPDYPNYYSENWLRIFYFWQGGFVSWAGQIAGGFAWYFYLRWRRQPVWAYFDCAAFAVPVAWFFGRTGCLLTGCCFGNPTDFFFHLTFTDPGSTAYYFYPNLPLHATQIYLMAKGLFIVLFLWVFSRKWWRFQGQLFAVGLGLYSVARFFIEFLRGDVERGVYFGGAVSSGQIAMAGYFVLSLFMYFYFRKKALPVPHAL